MDPSSPYSSHHQAQSHDLQRIDIQPQEDRPVGTPPETPPGIWKAYTQKELIYYAAHAAFTSGDLGQTVLKILLIAHHYFSSKLLGGEMTESGRLHDLKLRREVFSLNRSRIDQVFVGKVLFHSHNLPREVAITENSEKNEAIKLKTSITSKLKTNPSVKSFSDKELVFGIRKGICYATTLSLLSQTLSSDRVQQSQVEATVKSDQGVRATSTSKGWDSNISALQSAFCSFSVEDYNFESDKSQFNLLKSPNKDKNMAHSVTCWIIDNFAQQVLKGGLTCDEAKRLTTEYCTIFTSSKDLCHDYERLASGGVLNRVDPVIQNYFDSFVQASIETGVTDIDTFIKSYPIPDKDSKGKDIDKVAISKVLTNNKKMNIDNFIRSKTIDPQSEQGKALKGLLANAAKLINDVKITDPMFKMMLQNFFANASTLCEEEVMVDACGLKCEEGNATFGTSWGVKDDATFLMGLKNKVGTPPACFSIHLSTEDEKHSIALIVDADGKFLLHDPNIGLINCDQANPEITLLKLLQLYPEPNNANEQREALGFDKESSGMHHQLCIRRVMK